MAVVSLLLEMKSHLINGRRYFLDVAREDTRNNTVRTPVDSLPSLIRRGGERGGVTKLGSVVCGDRCSREKLKRNIKVLIAEFRFAF